MQCLTDTGGNLVAAAKKKKDESLLIHIENKKLNCLEAHYHKSCFKIYTNVLYHSDPEEVPRENLHYEKTYKHFCETIIEGRIINKREILRLSDLTNMFINMAKEKEDIDISTYKAASLKKRLRVSYSYLVFLPQYGRVRGKKSELVYVENLSATDVLQKKISGKKRTSSSSSISTDTDTDIDTNTPSTSRGKLEDDRDRLKELYHAAHHIKQSIDLHFEKLPEIPWPPLASNLTLTSASDQVPSELFNFIAWVTGFASDELPVEKPRVTVNDDLSRKILSISQDIIRLSRKANKSVILPKHHALAMAVKNMSGSKNLISLLNGLGHCISNNMLYEHDTALAELQIKRGENFIPSSIKPNIHCTLVWDNNDFGEETLSGKGTTHNTNGIIIQRQSNSHADNIPVSEAMVSVHCKWKDKKRSIEAPPVNLSTYHGKKRSGPKPFGDKVSLELDYHMSAMEEGKKADAAFFFTKLSKNENKVLPGWTGFNIQLKGNDIPPLTNIGYLPVIDASPVEMATIKTILDRSIAIADELGLENIDLVADQAIYSKLQEIRWHDESYSKRLVIRMGEFHTCMAFLACIGKRFGDAGLQDVLIESGVVASGSVTGVLNGHHYNRSIRSLKLFCEALQKLRWQSFLKTLTKEENEKALELVHDMQTNFPEKKYDEICQSNKYRELLTKYHKFIEDNNAENATFRNWSSFIEMFEVLLLYIRATRDGDWVLHLACLRYLLIWFFAYDRPNYSRSGTVHWFEMSVLEDTHPEIDREFKKGNFVAQRHVHHGFSQTACDQVIEQTVNRDSKIKGGITMYTQKPGAVHRFMLSSPERAAITRECHIMAGHSSSTDSHSELKKARMQRDEKDVQSIVDTIEGMVNPFDNQLEPDKLYHLASGSVAKPLVMKDLDNAKEIGDNAFIDFCKSRLEKDEVEFHEAIKRNKLKTFKDNVKPSVSRVKNKEISLKSDRYICSLFNRRKYQKYKYR